MQVMLAIALLAQVPDSVTNEAVKAFDQGGFKAVAAILLVACAVEGFVCWKLYVAVREMSTKLLEFATNAVTNSAQGQSVQREQAAAMTALAQEVRAGRGSS